MQYPVLLMPWPPRSTELRRIEWSDYLKDPGVGLLVDPGTGEPYDDVISVVVRVTDPPSSGDMESARIGETMEMPLEDFLAAESQRADLGRNPWTEVIEHKVLNQPPPLEVRAPHPGLPLDFERIKSFLFEVLESGPVSELEIIGRAADSGISPRSLREVKKRLRIASLRDQDTEYPRTLWRLRMSQAYKLRKRKSPDLRK